MSRDRINHRRDPFERQLSRAVRELVGDIGVERVISMAIGVHARADLDAGEWLTARLALIRETDQRSKAFAAIGRVALQAMILEVIRAYEDGELPPAQRDAVGAWLQDQS